MDQLEEAKEVNQKMKAKVGGKLKQQLSGIKPAKDRVESFN